MRTSEKKQAEFDAARSEQQARAFRKQVAALAVFGLLLLGFSLARGGWHNVFTRGWWRW